MERVVVLATADHHLTQFRGSDGVVLVVRLNNDEIVRIFVHKQSLAEIPGIRRVVRICLNGHASVTASIDGFHTVAVSSPEADPGPNALGEGCTVASPVGGEVVITVARATV